MRMSGLLGAAIALSGLTPIAPAHAVVITPGALMYTDLYRWQGQYGTPTWREILAEYDCTPGLAFYLWNVPSPPPPVIITPPPDPDPSSVASDPPDPSDPSGAPGGDPSDGASGALVDPIGTPTLPGGDTPGGATAVPEPSTWAMLLLGFAGLGYAGFRRKGTRVTGGLSDQPFRTPA